MNIYGQISKNKVKTYLILSVFVGLMMMVFYAIGKYVGDPTTYFFIGLFFSIFSGFGSYFFSDKIVLSMSGAKPASKQEYFDFYTVTENLAIANGMPMPKLYVIDDPAPNAFATGRNPQHAVVAASTGLLKRLDRSEIEGVIAHELSHIKNYDILVMSIVGVLVGTIVFVVDMAMRGLMWGGNDDNDRRGNAFSIAILLISLIVLPFLASLMQMAVSRRREFLADASGALLTRNPDALADALEKISADPHKLRTASHATAHLFISNPYGTSKARDFLTNLFSTHPPTAERVRILRSM
ncbi:MAG: zinc metalloprotease HtpX [Candidatus Moraniibacteriota bacterium]|nr:MAG: zinc metalloprotease HtpX [Candidatus Moranbacteria bacterium]